MMHQCHYRVSQLPINVTGGRANKRGRRRRELGRKGGTVQVAGRKYLLVALSCNINPLKQIEGSTHPHIKRHALLKILTIFKLI